MSFLDPLISAFESVLQAMSLGLKQTAASYCDLETAIDQHVLAAKDGSLVSVLEIKGLQLIPGKEEFDALHEGICMTLQPVMSRPGHNIQVTFSYDKSSVKDEIKHAIRPSWETAKAIALDLDDLFQERVDFLSQYVAHESCHIVVWTTPQQLSKEQVKDINKRKVENIKKHDVKPMRNAQGLTIPILELKDVHDSLTRSISADFKDLRLSVEILDVYSALKVVREAIDPRFTAKEWLPYLPGDKIPIRAKRNKDYNDISEVMWPSLSSQLIPRDGEILDLRTARIGDQIFAPLYIELFPKDIKIFNVLFQRVLGTKIPWRISFFVEGAGLSSISAKSAIAGILSFANQYNRLISDANELLKQIQVGTDDSVVKLRVSVCTWAPENKPELLRNRVAELSKAVQSWGNCDLGEISGDPFGATLTSCPAISKDYISTPSVAPLSDVIKMWPITRPASLWQQGAILLRSPDGKLMPYQPGSSLQTTWIDLVYARPGSGKSVLSNALNLGLCLQPGKERLPRIGIIDIGPSSSGLISLLKEALPPAQRHFVAYYRIQMTKEYCINPFDTQLGCRFPTPAERSFLVNFLLLLCTPIGRENTYDAVPDMIGMLVDELFKQKSEEGSPNRYTLQIDAHLDKAIDDINFNVDSHTTWWEVTDALFKAGRTHEAMLAQRYAVPILADVASVARASAIDDLYGKVTIETGENIIEAVSRMISSSLREYPILSSITRFDLGEGRVISLDLDEVAKSGGDAADRQTAVMYMLARYILGRNYYLSHENLPNFPKLYRDYHKLRITEIREDAKRLVLDEFHRTSTAKAVRNQVIVDMREGRKWNVQIALVSQSLDDFDETMVEFATSIFIMDAGPTTAIEKATNIFGLSKSEKLALRTKVHGPRAGGGTFLAQFATKKGITTQLLTATLGPSELWAFSTTAQDARIRNELYERIGPKNARRVLAHMFPGGSAASLIEHRLLAMKDSGELDAESGKNVINKLIEEILHEYQSNPIFKKSLVASEEY